MSSEEKPNFDISLAESMIGKHVLIGISYMDEHDNVTDLEQLHGIIRSAEESKGINIELLGDRLGEKYSLPPDLGVFRDANPGEYRLKSTGEVVVNPDLLCTWQVYTPPDENEE